MSIIGQEQINYMLEKFQNPEAIQVQIDSGDQCYFAMIDNIPKAYMGFISNKPNGKFMLSKIYVEGSVHEIRIGSDLLKFTKNRAILVDICLSAVKCNLWQLF